MKSSLPNRRYANGLRRVACISRATEFFDEYVLADAVHESIAAVDLASGLARQQPELVDVSASVAVFKRRARAVRAAG